MPEVTPRVQTLRLPYSAPNLNDLIRATNDASSRRSVVRYQAKIQRRRKPMRVRDDYTAMKAQWATRVQAHVREQRIEAFPNGAHIAFRIFEVDRRRDPDNVCAGTAKFVLDGLVKCGVLPNDGWGGVLSLQFEWSRNPNKGSVEVTLSEEP
jgi:hypothetical protein